MQLNFQMEPEPTGARARLNNVLKVCRVVYQYGFIPYVIYLGIKKGSDPGLPEITLRSVLW
ncbi:translocase of outer membrane 7 [Dermatophagoides farinae]|uniref:Mitochondrial import receptor subunit TOM7 homolog n=1 Tax=Dermatophagoides farinae TaxID=6954 RepID=A0A922L723_DERFA|nr:mitochondrial import receptor subunit tom7-like protein [Dermatophagoides farinae]KAH9521708.1 Mitochondrial import receptor subunit TOM7 [Dermatophagoides farinae]